VLAFTSIFEAVRMIKAALDPKWENLALLGRLKVIKVMNQIHR
jgi:hypothetical protein